MDLLKRPSTDFAAVRDGRQSMPLYIDVDLTTARSISGNNPLILNIAGNSFYTDADTTNGGNAIVHFQDTNLGNASAPFFVSPGFIANVGFTQLLIENAAQAGKRMRIFYGVDIDFQAGVNASVVNATISNQTFQSRIATFEAGIIYASSYKSATALAANATETVFTAAANLNGAIVHRAECMSTSASGAGSGFLAKATAPANTIDGDIICSNLITYSGATATFNGKLENPIYIPAGKGLFFIAGGLETSAYRSALYTLL